MEKTVIKYTPDNPQWPDKDEANLPRHLNPLPLFAKGTGFWKRLLLAPVIRRQYLHTEDYFTYIDHLDAWCCIPKNFVTDNASVPKALPFVTPDGILEYGSHPHDFGYRFGGLFLSFAPGEEFRFTVLSKEELDVVFEKQNNKANGLPCLNKVARKALDLFGGPNFKPRPVTAVDWSKPVYPV